MDTPNLFTVAQFAQEHQAFPIGGLRFRIFNELQNGLAQSGAIIRNGRRVLIDEEKFFDWVVGSQKQKPKLQKKRINTANFYTKETNHAVSDEGDGRLIAFCPFCEDIVPTLLVKARSGGFDCSNCGERDSDIISFLKKKHGLGFYDALEYLKRHYGGDS
jgi:hypothetical protein